MPTLFTVSVVDLTTRLPAKQCNRSNILPPPIERERFRVDFILPSTLVAQCLDLGEEEARRLRVPELRVRFRDFAVPFRHCAELNDVLRGVSTITVTKLEDSRIVVRDRMRRNQWTAGMGMCAIMDVIDDVFHLRSRLLLEEASRQMAFERRVSFVQLE